jgi:hypothetical protein
VKAFTLVVERESFRVCYTSGGKLLKTWVPLANNKRKAVTDSTREGLIAKLRKYAVDKKNGRIEAAQLESHDLRAHLAAVEVLRPWKVSPDIAAREYAAARAQLGTAPLLDAVRFYLSHGTQAVHSRTLNQVIDEFKERLLKRSDSYRDVSGHDLVRLARKAGEKPMIEVTAEDVAAVVEGTGRKTAKGFIPAGSYRREQVRTTLVTLFRFARANRYLPPGPTAAHSLAKEDCVALQRPVWDPGHLRRGLDAISAHEAGWLPWTAISALANIRSIGIQRLDWSDLHWADDLIELPRGKAKKKRRMVVAISPELKSWLSPHWQRSGPVCPGDRHQHGEFCRRLRVKYELPYYKNVLRRSFISYRLAITGDEALVATEAGTSIEEIRDTYSRVRTFGDRLVTKTLGEAWFATARNTAQNVVQAEFANAI